MRINENVDSYMYHIHVCICNQCRLWEVFRANSDCLCMVLELCAGGNLENHIFLVNKTTGSRGLPEDEARRLFLQLIKSLRFCHSRGVAHR